MNNLEIFEFFKDCPKHLRTHCIEEILIFGIRKLKDKLKRNLDPSEMLSINKKKPQKIWKIDSTPEFKCTKKPTTQERNSIKFSASRKPSVNICPDTTCLPFKNIDLRRTKSSNFCSTQASDRESKWKKPIFSESMEKENHVIRMADEFLKNPFAKISVTNRPFLTNMLIDSNLYSTIDLTSPTAKWASDL